jgi:hypothetical protein
MVVDPDDRPSTGTRRKDRKRWCGGKVGLEHVYGEPNLRYKALGPGLPAVWESRCERCGRKHWILSVDPA